MSEKVLIASPDDKVKQIMKEADEIAKEVGEYEL